MEWLILQNTNAYEEGFTAAWDGIRHRLWKNRGPETEAPLLPFLDLDGIKLRIPPRPHRTRTQFLRARQPHTLIFWGQRDIFFTPEGGEAYLRDLPNAELHRLQSGHFAVEVCLDAIASNIKRFYDETVAAPRVARWTA
jgi:pimeloyl-ACP methyl ester carboxylesterase